MKYMEQKMSKTQLKLTNKIKHKTKQNGNFIGILGTPKPSNFLENKVGDF